MEPSETAETAAATKPVAIGPLDPQIAEASDEAVGAMKGIFLAENWDIDLFAAEPDVANIVSFDIDARGRLFVCESFRQDRGVSDNRSHDETWLLADLASKTVQDRIDYHRKLLGDAAVTYTQHDDRIRRLVDTDHDGKADQSVVLASGFHRLEEGTGAGVLVRGNHIYYTCIPRLWNLIDKDDDGVADDRVVLSDGYGVRVAFRGHDLHGLVIGPDGRLYFSVGDRGYHVTTKENEVLANPATGAVFRCELDGSGLEVYCTGLRNPQELAFNDLGDWFTVDNNSDSGDKARIVQLLHHGDSGWRMYYQYLSDRGSFNEDRLWEPVHSEQPSYIVPPVANFTDGPSGLAFYPGTGFGDALKDHFLICDFRGTANQSGVRSFQLDPQGAFYKLGHSDQPIWSVLATDVAFGPDGAIYISDWVDGWKGVGKGRIYRVTDSQQTESDIVGQVATRLARDWSSLRSEDLVESLSHVDRRIRLEAQWELAARSDTDSFLGVAVNAEALPLARRHAIWGVDMIARLDSSKTPTVLDALRPLTSDPDSAVRAEVAKVLGQRGDTAAQSQLIQLLADKSPRVRYAAAMALSVQKASQAFVPVLQMIAENGTAAAPIDPAIRHAGQTYLANAIPVEMLSKLKNHDSELVRQSAVVALRRIKSGEVTAFLNDKSSLVMGEAVRAIHDEPIPQSLEALAALVESPLANVPILRRVIAANFRIGTLASATALAKFAARNSSPDAMRVETLDCLANWDSLDPRDRVLGDLRPAVKREIEDAVSAISPEVDSLLASSETVREKTIEVAAKLGIKQIAPSLASRTNDANHSFRVRANALMGLSKLDTPKAIALAREVRLAPANALVEASLKVLAEHDRAGSIDRFVEATTSRRLAVRQLAWDILAKCGNEQATETISQAVRQYIDGTLDGDVQLNVLEAAEGRIPDSLQEELHEHQLALAETNPLAPWLVALEGGDSKKGRSLFFDRTELSCVRCHKVDQNGGEVGPDLTVIGKQKERVYLLESICIPDSSIADGFGSMVIANDAGQLLTGVVKSENDELLELIQADGSIVRIPQDEIVTSRKGKSAMPADLLQHLSERELRDLVAYLASLREAAEPTAKVQ
ncbi:HEAT repeat protein [Planctomycetes bacterium CA13]|uniref:HEAT repeat protein n=1 Tax=Novipirellula herctigrandis TaxID=2527986 RepID=A0A5C5ZAC6_9BACT|nr:HEAT repeat protein [Planctomycetes bacterium CA13]